MKRFWTYLFLSVLLAGVQNIYAQDIHFSQFYNSPLTLNPALTGKVHATYRIIFNYRNQWFGPVNGKTSFSTLAASADVPIRFKSKDILGVGLYFINDRSGSGKLKNITTMFSFAYNKALGSSKNHYLGVGLQFGYVQKTLDRENIKLSEEIILNGDGTSIISDDIKDTKTGNFDMQIGLHWNSKFSEKVNIYAGYAVYHFLQPKQSFTGNDEKLSMRNVVNAGGDFALTSKMDMKPSFIFMMQAKAKEVVPGITFGFELSKAADFDLGCFYRVKDAVIPYMGLTVKGFMMGVSYDATASEISGTNGGVEFSLMYKGKYVPVPDVVPSLYCPRF